MGKQTKREVNIQQASEEVQQWRRKKATLRRLRTPMMRIKSIDRRILAVLAGIPAFLCRCGFLFLSPANPEPMTAIAQDTAVGRLVVVEKLIVTAESTNTAVTVEVSSDIPNPANMSRPSSTVGLTGMPQPTAILCSFLTPTQGWFSSEYIGTGSVEWESLNSKQLGPG